MKFKYFSGNIFIFDIRLNPTEEMFNYGSFIINDIEYHFDSSEFRKALEQQKIIQALQE